MTMSSKPATQFLNLRVLALFGALGVLTAAMPAKAGFIIEYDPAKNMAPVVVVPTPAPAPSNLRVQTRPAEAPTVALTQSGSTPPGVATIGVNVKNTPIVQALRQIVPKSWRAFSRDPDIKIAGKVTFKGGNRPWHLVLEEVLRDKGLVAYVDWERSEVTFSRAAQLTTAK